MNQKLNNLLKKPWIPPTLSGLIGLGVGFGASCLYFTRKTYKLIEETEQIENEIQELKNEQLQLDFERAEKDREFNKMIAEAAYVSRELKQKGEHMLSSLTGLRDAQEDNHPSIEGVSGSIILSNDRPISKLVSVPREKPNIVNVFDNANGDDWDYEAEKSTRTEDQPYIIHVDEFMADEMGWGSQSTLTWYAGDDILTDSHDTPIYNPASVVGELRFGHGSQDPNTVYVRNEKLQSEYEILRDEGLYEEVVLDGAYEEKLNASDLKHWNSPRKFRRE